MPIRTPKALCHPDGGLFVVWHEELYVYAPIICDEDVPPVPGVDLFFRDKSITDYEGLVWRPVLVQIVPSVEPQLYPYEGED